MDAPEFSEGSVGVPSYNIRTNRVPPSSYGAVKGRVKAPVAEEFSEGSVGFPSNNVSPS